MLLVGSNPLPNFLAAATLRPQRAALLFSGGTEGPRERLATALHDALGVTTKDRLVDPMQAPDVLRSARTLFPHAHLNYTGGTKVMAAMARLAFAEAGGLPNDASYVDERAGLLRFDDGTSAPLDPSAFDVDRCLQLHGVTTQTAGARPADPTEADADAIADEVLDMPGRAGELYEARKLLGDQPLTVGGRQVPDASWSRKDYDRWERFLGGGWLEAWAAARARDCAPDAQIRHGVNGVRLGRQFEVDVVIVRQHRLYVISCTTDRNKDLCKLKAFEVAARAAHVGGDLARSAFACLADSPVTDRIQMDVESAWDASNPPRIFGLPHLREWHAGDRRSLAHWLAS